MALLFAYKTLSRTAGELRTAVALDREKVARYSLVARATDGGGLWCEAEVTVVLLDVNDSPPMFSMPHYTTSAYENTATKALLTRIQAIDPDLGTSMSHFCTCSLICFH